MSFTQVILLAHYSQDGPNPVSGRVLASLSGEISDGTQTLQPDVTESWQIDANGNIAAIIPSTEDSTTTPQGVVWKITELIDGAPANVYGVSVPNTGATLLSGVGAPASGTGANGNFYIDTSAGNLYGPKTAGAWPSTTIKVTNWTGTVPATVVQLASLTPLVLATVYQAYIPMAQKGYPDGVATLDSTGDVPADELGNAVISFATRTGAVVPEAGDYSVLQVTGAAPTLPRQSVATATTVTAVANTYLPVDTTSNPVTVDLPNAPANDTLVAVKMIVQGGSNAVTVSTQGSDVFNKVSGPTTYVLSLVDQGALLQYDHATGVWTVIVDDLPLADLDSRYVAQIGSVTSVFGRTGAVTAQSGDYSVAEVTGAAPLASPSLTGTPTAPTAPALTNDTQVATTAYTDAAVEVETTRAETAEAARIKVRGAWAAATAYALNDLVTVTSGAESGGIYLCTTAHTSGSSFGTNLADWEQIQAPTGTYAALQSPPHGPVLTSMPGTGNEALGSGALSSASLTGNYNTASGFAALFSNTTGSNNTASGFEALFSNTTGSNNTASGYKALYLNTTGSNNTASGFAALFSNTIGNYNTASGFAALFSNTTGNYNTASGYDALYLNTTGSNNTASGYEALYSNTTGNYNTASGFAALLSNTTGSNSTASGHSALYSNTTGSNNTAIGYEALFSNTTGNYNTASGFAALLSNTTGSSNTASGFEALYSPAGVAANGTFWSSDQTATGYQSGMSAPDSRTDTCTTTSGSSTVYDAAISAGDAGAPIAGTGIPAGSFVGSGANAPVAGVSFTIVNSSNTPVTATAAGVSVQIGTTQINGISVYGYQALAGGAFATALGYKTNAGAAGAVAIGTDHTGAGANATSPDHFHLGTANHKLFIPGLPTADPHVVGQLWANGGVVTVSAG
jgi:hypothetical protein